MNKNNIGVPKLNWKQRNKMKRSLRKMGYTSTGIWQKDDGSYYEFFINKYNHKRAYLGLRYLQIEEQFMVHVLDFTED